MFYLTNHKSYIKNRTIPRAWAILHVYCNKCLNGPRRMSNVDFDTCILRSNWRATRVDDLIYLRCMTINYVP